MDARQKFEQLLKAEAEEFAIDWALVEILYVSYKELYLSDLRPPPDENMVRIVVLAFEGKTQARDVDDWFRSYCFTYCIYWHADILVKMFSSGAGKGTLNDIATKLNKIFKGEYT